MSCLDDVVKIHRPSGRESVPINARRWKPIQASRPRLRHWGWRRSTGRNWWRSLLQFDRGRRGVLPFRSDPTATLAPPPPADHTAAVRSDTLKTNIQNRCKRERKINTRKFHTPHTHTPNRAQMEIFWCGIMCATPWTVKRSIRPSSFFRLQAQNVCKTTNPGDRLSQSENGRRREKNSGEMCATG